MNYNQENESFIKFYYGVLIVIILYARYRYYFCVETTETYVWEK